MLNIDQCIEPCFVNVITAAPAPPTRRPSVGTGYYLVMVIVRVERMCVLLLLPNTSLIFNPPPSLPSLTTQTLLTHVTQQC